MLVKHFFLSVSTYKITNYKKIKNLTCLGIKHVGCNNLQYTVIQIKQLVQGAKTAIPFSRISIEKSLPFSNAIISPST